MQLQKYFNIKKNLMETKKSTTNNNKKKQHINKRKDKNTRKECFEKHTIF